MFCLTLLPYFYARRQQSVFFSISLEVTSVPSTGLLMHLHVHLHMHSEMLMHLHGAIWEIEEGNSKDQCLGLQEACTLSMPGQ